MAEGICSVDGCGRGGRLRRGLCDLHYQRWRAHGDVRTVKKGGIEARASCSVEGCQRGGKIVRGLCGLHYSRWKEHGDPLAPVRAHRLQGSPPARCAVEGCERPARTQGWCRMHYQRWVRNGDVGTAAGRSRSSDFWSHVDKDGPVPQHRPELGPCWLWTGASDIKGYGRLRRRNGRGYHKAHRLAYEALVGPIPEGLVLDHVCHNGSGCAGGDGCPHRACVNPAHLEPVTQRTNVRRGRRGRQVSASS